MCVLPSFPKFHTYTKLQIKLNIFLLVIVQFVIFLGRDSVSFICIRTLRMNVLLRNVGIRPQEHTVSEPEIHNLKVTL
jgi:hypothetical protein